MHTELIRKSEELKMKGNRIMTCPFGDYITMTNNLSHHMKSHHYAFSLLCKNHALDIYKNKNPTKTIKQVWSILAKDWRLA